MFIETFKENMSEIMDELKFKLFGVLGGISLISLVLNIIARIKIGDSIPVAIGMGALVGVATFIGLFLLFTLMILGYSFVKRND